MRILVATGPFRGHVAPTSALVAALTQAGHAVTWLTGTRFRDVAEDAGATFAGIAPRLVEILDGTKPLHDHVLDFSRVGPALRLEWREAIPTFDAVVADLTMVGIIAEALATHVPLVTLGVVPALHVEPETTVHLQACMPGLEYPRSDVPLVCIGPLLPPARPWTPPDWWATLPTTPTIAVTQGTLDTDPTKLIAPAIAMLADLPAIQGIVLTDDPPADLPPNVYTAPWVPYATLLPRVRAWLTNGGYGGVVMAAAAGVPSIVAGTLDDKAAVGARVAWAGCGLDLATERPTPTQLRAAIETLSTTPRFTERAQEFALRAQACQPLRLATALIEQAARRERVEAAA